MVKNIPVDFTDEYGCTNVAEIACDSSTLSIVSVDGDEVAYKRVVISGVWPDTCGETFSISISPIRAALLVKRLVSTLDGLVREGVVIPPVNSHFMDVYDSVVDCDRMPTEYSDFCQDIRSSARLTDGELLADALPPAIL